MKWSPTERCEVTAAHAVLPSQPAAGRTLAIIGGKFALTVRNLEGRGGRRQDYALALALDRVPEMSALAADTDGSDGGEGSPTDAAGAIIDATTFATSTPRTSCTTATPPASSRPREDCSCVVTHTDVHDLHVIPVDA